MTVQEWLGEDNEIGIDINEKKYQDKNETFDEMIYRVSGGDPDLETLIRLKRFLTAGRTLTNRGLLNSGSYFNCYSSGFVPDDYEQILEINKIIGLTYKSQGGQGLSLSKLRPKGTPIKNRFTSDGIVPFMEIFNTTTKETSQGGSRKGALMISLDIRHKEAETFINIKSQEGKIEKANLSLEIDDEFMCAVKRYYDTGETITIHEKRDYSGHIIEYDIVPIELYKKLVQNCYDWADPACLFTNRFRNYNLMEFDDEYQIETCNPCGEQPLPKHFCCNLGSANLVEYVLNPFTNKAEFNYASFIQDIPIMIRALDTLVDENANNHPIEAQKQNSLNYRNIGLGVMGYANALMKLGIKYGSQEAKEFTDKLFRTLFKTAVLASVELSKEKGSFPKYKECVFNSTILRNVFSQDELDEFKKTGIRNCSLISIAPTGSISTMLGRSGGCEPEFAIKYTRKTESLNNGEDKYYDIYCLTAKEYMQATGQSTLPDYFVSSKDIYWKDRVDTQAIMQKYVDTAISSTVNLPNSATIEDMEQLYLYAWEQGLKGITIYKDGCKRSGILTTESKSSESDSEAPTTTLERGYIIQVDDDVIGRKRSLNTGCGTLHCQGLFDPVSGELTETYFSKGSTGGCNSFMVAVSRLISLASRGGIQIDDIIDQLNSCPTCPSYAVRKSQNGDTSKGSCCPMAIGYALKDMNNQIQEDLGIVEEPIENNTQRINNNNPKCPECGNDLYFEGGCNSCKICGYSKCE